MKETTLLSFEQAEALLLSAFADNPWFVKQHWPENRLRVLWMARDILERFPKRTESLFEPGCGNGYISYLFSVLGYKVTACDSWDLPERDVMFEKAGIGYYTANLNDLNCFPLEADGKYDGVLFGEVFEHLLNHPLGVLQQINRVMKTGGTLLLTTPNPSTAVNAVRLLFDSYSPWGARTFLTEPKFVDSKIIDRGDVHYREYRSAEVVFGLCQANFEVISVRYLPVGASQLQSPLKRLAKKVFEAYPNRLFGTTQYLLATKR